MIKTYMNNWNIGNPCFHANSMRRPVGLGKIPAFQTLCNGAMVWYSEYNEEGYWQPACYIEEPIPRASIIRRRLSQMDTGDFPF